MSEEAAIYEVHQANVLGALTQVSAQLLELTDRLDVMLSTTSAPFGATRSLHIDKLAAALAKANLSIQNAEKNTENEFLGNRYADLGRVHDTIRLPLAENGLSVVGLPQPTEAADIVELETMLLHESGQFVSARWRMKAKDPGAQTIGAVLTYLRRYSNCAIVGIAQKDDDGNSAMPGADEYERISAKEADAILIEADQLFGDKADSVVARMLDKVFSTSHNIIDRVTDIPAGQAEAAINLLRNQHKREMAQVEKKPKADDKKPQSAS